MAGLFEILEKKGHSFHLNLLSSIKVYPVFHTEKLRLVPENPLPSQKNLELLALVINDYEEYEVQEVLTIR